MIALTLYVSALLSLGAASSVGGLEELTVSSSQPSIVATDAVQPQPIIPSDTSTTITQIALLMVASGGVLAAIPPIIRALRKGKDDEDEEEQRQRDVVAIALALREAERLNNPQNRPPVSE